MSQSKAIRFVKLASKYEDQREICYKSESKGELLKLLDFTEPEFENAINMHLVRCQTHEDAAVFQELRTWFALL